MILTAKNLFLRESLGGRNCQWLPGTLFCKGIYVSIERHRSNLWTLILEAICHSTIQAQSSIFQFALWIIIFLNYYIKFFRYIHKIRKKLRVKIVADLLQLGHLISKKRQQNSTIFRKFHIFSLFSQFPKFIYSIFYI